MKGFNVQRSLTALMGGLTLSAASLTAHAAGDISGTWEIAAPVNALRTDDGKLPPLKPAALVTYQAHLGANRKGDHSWDPVAKCKPPGEPRTFTEMSWPFEIMQSEHRIDFLFQWNRLDRAIEVTDKPGKQTLDNEAPYYFGQSQAHWEGDTLVVDVIGFKENTTLDAAGLPHTQDMELTERFHTADNGQKLVAQIHVVDTATYTQPWDTTLTFKRLPAGTRIREDVCFERLKLNDYATLDNSITK